MARRRSDRPCTGCGKMMQITPTSAAEPYCRPCRREGNARSHGTDRMYATGCRCDVCRTHKRETNRLYVARRREEGRPVDYSASRARVTRDCALCGAGFMAVEYEVRAGRGIYCSGRCQRLAARGLAYAPPGATKPRAPRKSEFRRRAERLALKAAKGTSGGGRVYVQGACSVCGEDFLSAGAASRYCSTECREKNRYRLHGLSWLDRMAIFDRDGWACHLCGERVDYTVEPKHPLFATLDHLVPRSHGGSDDPSNLATCHAFCNSYRRDMPLSEMNREDVRARLLDRVSLSSMKAAVAAMPAFDEEYVAAFAEAVRVFDFKAFVSETDFTELVSRVR